MAPRRLGRPGNDLDSILDAAFVVFRARGYDATSVEMIAAAAGITKSGVYHHVRTKEELLERGVNRILERIRSMLDEPAAHTGSPGERLRYLVGRGVEIVLVMPNEAAVFVRLQGKTAVEQRVVHRRRRFDDEIAELVASAAEAGEVRDDLDPAMLTRLIFSMVNGVAEWFDPSGQMQPDELADAVRRVVFDGLRGVDRQATGHNHPPGHEVAVDRPNGQ